MEVVLGLESGFEVDFEVAAGAREGAAVIETQTRPLVRMPQRMRPSELMSAVAR